MNAVSHRSTKVFGLLGLLAAAALTGCAASNGTAYSGAAARAVAVGVEAPPPGDHMVCSGGQASRFPEREAIGRVCRETLSLRELY